MLFGMKFVTVLDAFTKTRQIALWHLVTNTVIALKTGLRRLEKMIRNCFEKCMENQEGVLK